MTEYPKERLAAFPTTRTDQVIQDSTNTPIHDLLTHAQDMERAMWAIADLVDTATALEDYQVIECVREIAATALRGTEGVPFEKGEKHGT